MIGKSEWYFIWGLLETSLIISYNNHDWLEAMERSKIEQMMDIRMFILWQEEIRRINDANRERTGSEG